VKINGGDVGATDGEWVTLRGATPGDNHFTVVAYYC
jgi:hypothetical protein